MGILLWNFRSYVIFKNRIFLYFFPFWSLYKFWLICQPYIAAYSQERPVFSGQFPFGFPGCFDCLKPLAGCWRLRWRSCRTGNWQDSPPWRILIRTGWKNWLRRWLSMGRTRWRLSGRWQTRLERNRGQYRYKVCTFSIVRAVELSHGQMPVAQLADIIFWGFSWHRQKW